MDDTTNRPAKSAEALMREADRLTDPLRRLERLGEARKACSTTHDQIGVLLPDAITAAREAGATWPTIAEWFGVSTTRAMQLAGR